MLVSAVIAEGRPATVVECCVEGKVTLVIADDVMSEFARTLAQKMRLSRDEIKQRLAVIAQCAEPVDLDFQEDFVEHIPGHIADSRIVSAAVKAKVDYLVTGDRKHMLPLGVVDGVKIITPEQFLMELSR